MQARERTRGRSNSSDRWRTRRCFRQSISSRPTLSREKAPGNILVACVTRIAKRTNSLGARDSRRAQEPRGENAGIARSRPASEYSLVHARYFAPRNAAFPAIRRLYKFIKRPRTCNNGRWMERATTATTSDCGRRHFGDFNLRNHRARK